MRPETPVTELARLEALRRYEILDTETEQAFDDLTALAAHICGVPISLISLVDSDRQWFKSKVGLELDQTHRDVSFCGYVATTTDTYAGTTGTVQGASYGFPREVTVYTIVGNTGARADLPFHLVVAC